MEFVKKNQRCVNITVRNDGVKVVEITTIQFNGKRKIDWNGVESYLRKYVGESYTIDDTDEVIFIGTDFPDEYSHSNYNKRALGTIGKAKANASQAIPELVKIATNITFRTNNEEKHNKNAKYGWYRCTVHFTIPITNEDRIIIGKNKYQGRMIIRCDSDGKKYLYDIIDIKKET